MANMISQLGEFLKGEKGVLKISAEPQGMYMMADLHLHQLPDFLILKIFEYLCIREKLILRRVSKQWHQLLYDFGIWKEIRLNEEIFLSSRINPQILKRWMNDFGATIQSLDFSYADWITDEEVIYAARTCKNLRSLSLKSCPKVTDTGIVEVAQNCARLRKINVFLSSVSSRGFEELTRCCPHIECAKLGSQGNTHRMLKSICDHSTNIVSISIHDVVPYSTREPTVDDPLVKRMAIKFHLLRRICFTWCCYITDGSLVAIATHCLNLTTLKLRECPQVSDEGLKSILQKCVHLKNLCLERMYGVTDCLGVGNNEGHCSLPNLLSLKIFDTKVTDHGMETLTDQCPELRELSFGEYSFHPKFIQGFCLQNVAQKCKKLKSLHVFCERIGNEDLKAVGESLHGLTHLSIGDCHHCTGDAVLEMVECCSNLQFLSIKNCDAIEDEHARDIRDTLPYLTTFELPGNTRITPFGSWYVMENALRHPFR